MFLALRNVLSWMYYKLGCTGEVGIHVAKKGTLEKLCASLYILHDVVVLMIVVD